MSNLLVIMNWLTTVSVFWWITGLVMLGLFVWAVIYILMHKGDRKPPPGKNPSLDILKNKYDYGEIDSDEFKKHVNELM
jgi:uncharacterized membrane protein